LLNAWYAISGDESWREALCHQIVTQGLAPAGEAVCSVFAYVFHSARRKAVDSARA